MADTIKIEDIEERVVLVGVSEQDGDDADDSLSELAELVKTAGATVVGTLIQRREKIPGCLYPAEDSGDAGQSPDLKSK